MVNRGGREKWINKNGCHVIWEYKTLENNEQLYIQMDIESELIKIIFSYYDSSIIIDLFISYPTNTKYKHKLKDLNLNNHQWLSIFKAPFTTRGGKQTSGSCKA